MVINDRLRPLLEKLNKPGAITPEKCDVMDRWLATAAEKICSSPNENIDWIQLVWAICDNSAKTDKALSRRAVLTGVAIIIDIIPGYKSTAVGVQSNKKISKQAEEILNYDTKLVEAYQGLLTRLKTMKETRGMCALMRCSSLWSFNHFDRLLSMVISTGASGNQTAIQTLAEVLKEDEAVELATKNIVIMIGRLKSPQQLLHVAPLLRLARTDTSSNIVEEHKSVSVRFASGEEDNDINRDLDAGFAGLNKERVRKAEAVVLAEVLVVYLRVLRTAHLYPKEVVIACLKGIGEKANTANLELVIEIAHELRDFFTEQLQNAANGNENAPLLAAHAALALLKLAGSSAGKAIGEVIRDDDDGGKKAHTPVQGALATCLESLPKLLRLLLSQEDATDLLEELCRGVMGVDATLGGSKNAAPWMAKAMGEALVTAPFGRKPAHTLLEILTKFGSVRGCLDEEGMIVGLDYTHPVCLYWTVVAARYHYDPECSKVIVPQLERFSRDLDRNRSGGQSGSGSTAKRGMVEADEEEGEDDITLALSEVWLWSDTLRSKRRRLSTKQSTTSSTAIKHAASRFQPVNSAEGWKGRLL
ncbi:hypothetical protein FOL47_001873 [Perkinsus chesapeaki]|uniref:Nucleolar complex-associated protein 3 N-terminal domain-containing protein n=1 Tax=Perkinsus chesapeaki TaxID=330153 RepID=A0A7J6MGU4_PERCH|nr:hypothetical protein FOL47_001873 [Perkinsus chesapeaki]